MRFLNKRLAVIIAILPIMSVQAQYTDTPAIQHSINNTGFQVNKWKMPTAKKPVGAKTFIVSGILMAYGFRIAGKPSTENF